MPRFYLTPTVAENCPECGTEATIPFIIGKQVLKCSNCEAKLSFEFPAQARKVLDLVKQMEQKIEEMIFSAGRTKPVDEPDFLRPKAGDKPEEGFNIGR